MPRSFEFGAGSAEKIGILLAALDRPRAYVPVEILERVA
jgi:uncharacterized SAM-dependent methyltransferase